MDKDNSNFRSGLGNQAKNAPGLPPDAEARVILVRIPLPDRMLGQCKLMMTVLLSQEARKEGVFAGLTSGLASGEHPSRHEASRVIMSIFFVPWFLLYLLLRSHRSVSSLDSFFSCYWVASFWFQEKCLSFLWRSWAHFPTTIWLDLKLSSFQSVVC